MGSINSYTPFVFPEGRDMAIENLMDIYSKIAPLNGQFYFDIILRPLVTKDYPYFKEHHRILSQEARLLMKNLDYLIQPNPLDQNCYLSQLGREVNLAGGHYKYLEAKNEKSQREELKEKADLTNSLTQARTGWIIVIVIILSLLVAILALK